jgi:hypothetical protein
VHGICGKNAMTGCGINHAVIESPNVLRHDFRAAMRSRGGRAWVPARQGRGRVLGRGLAGRCGFVFVGRLR